MSPDEDGPGVLSGVFAEVEDRKCIHFETIRICE